MPPVVRKILFTTDLSDLSFEAWPHAIGLAEKFGAELHAVVALEEPYALAPYEQYGVLLQALKDVKPQVEQRLAERTKDRPSSVTVRNAVLETSSPSQAILDYVKREKIDLVVAATHGRSGLPHLLLGSFAEKLVRTSPVPVLVVRPAQPAQTGKVQPSR
jgi:nucleotide-binding universal stress UspA family protein